MKKLFLLTLAGLFMTAAAAYAERDISGVYTGQQGTVIIKKADAKLVKVKPKHQTKYNMGFGGEFGATPERLAKVKGQFTDTGQMMPDAYLVTFDMGKNTDCPLTWKSKVAQFKDGYLEHRDIDQGGVYFSFVVEGDDLELNMPMNWVRSHNSDCISAQRFTKKK